ncbi:hypothetical protein X953_19545 [Virgibacillus sp. SK37]|nr:hypothetical protein X953_19545 [Virgibacillus sp. SK37]
MLVSGAFHTVAGAVSSVSNGAVVVAVGALPVADSNQTGAGSLQVVAVSSFISNLP